MLWNILTIYVSYSDDYAHIVCSPKSSLPLLHFISKSVVFLLEVYRVEEKTGLFGQL